MVLAAADLLVLVPYLEVLHLVGVSGQDASVLEEDPSSFWGHDSVANVGDAENEEDVDAVALTVDADVNCVDVDSGFVVEKVWVVICIVTQTEE